MLAICSPFSGQPSLPVDALCSLLLLKNVLASSLLVSSSSACAVNCLCEQLVAVVVFVVVAYVLVSLWPVDAEQRLRKI